MATSIQYAFSHSPSSIKQSNTLKKTQSLKLSKLSQNSIMLPSLKQICEQGNLREAFLSLTNNSISHEAYAVVLELCASKKALSQGKQLHAHILKSTPVYDAVFLSTKLVFLYGKCGSIVDAQKVFDEMPEKTVFTWNALLGSYMANGESRGALDVYRDMQVSKIHPDAFTFSCIFKAVGELEDLYGTQLHGLAIKHGFVSNVFVSNSIMGMYIKYNCLNSAIIIFESDRDRNDVVSWNSIISAYSADGQSVEALRLFREMQKENMGPSAYTFVAILQACEESSSDRVIMEIHAAILKSIHYLDMYVMNALIVTYSRCGKMNEAARIFNSMVEKDTVSWNSMLSGFIQNGFYAEALELFNRMQIAYQKPDKYSIISLATICGRLGFLLNGMELHAYAIKSETEVDLRVGNTFIDMYAKLRKNDYMGSVFNRMRYKDSISWTTIITSNTLANSHLKAIELFREVVTQNICVDEMMIGSIVLACSELKHMPFVKQIHCYMIRRGLSDIVLHNTLLSVYAEFGYIDYASSVFYSIKVKNIVSWTSMISCYVKNGFANEALQVFISMQEAGIKLDGIAISSLLSAIADLSALRKGKEVHGFLIRNNFLLTSPIANSLVDMYACCGTLENSVSVFNCTTEKDLVLYTSMINALGIHGRGKEATKLFKMMTGEDLDLDHVLFLALLNACSHSGLVDEGRIFFRLMKEYYKLDPWPEHYACIVDLLGRANYLEEAYEFVKSMVVEPTSAVWCALLGACRVHSNEALGNLAGEKLLDLDLDNPGSYVLVSNFYAANGKWKEVEKVRMRMKRRSLKKEPACSWIEIRNKVHTFIANDSSHIDSVEIYNKLGEIYKKLETEGYKGDIKCVLHNVAEEEKMKRLYGHSERLAIAYGLISLKEGCTVRVTKNLRVCDDCHTFSKLVSKHFECHIIVRDANRFHHFRDGFCSCGDFW